ncbi:GNAT family N-acetyltransferase [Amycolatopsis antarctica]|uniref:GNAT family N-acetyltransferase n=1 Tax=Amycolatopsis antarctica TaxID=1854586 RepID=A0A263D8R5_9PSEU|nr:GNAT family N-acetyltransferase [Amycolatopsis antarctica]OZM74398.1 GNAT family N-acetyltransferase [Amycolatopsis antarctica]
MSIPEVRPATADDAAEIARIQRDTWRTAYADLVGADALAELDSAEVDRRWAEAIAHPDSSVLVATEAGATVGFCVAGRAPEEESAAADGTAAEDAATVGLVSTILVEPRWGRRGHGGRLLAVAAEAMRAEGVTRGITWVAESDSAALGFFRTAGWNPDGTVRTLDTGGGTLREIRLTGEVDLHLDA